MLVESIKGQAVKTRIIKIGNSHGIRLTKALLEQSQLGDEVEVEAQPSQITIRPARRAREGWAEQFDAMARAGDDQLLDDEAMYQTTWDEEEWEWQSDASTSTSSISIPQ